MKRCLAVAALVFGATAAAPRTGRSQLLTFEGLLPLFVNNAPIGNFYNGGAGPNLGVEFAPNASALCLSTLTSLCSPTSRGGQGDPASQNGALFFLSGGSTFLNRAAGFTDELSFFYSSAFQPGSFSIWSGLNGTGELLASMALGPTPVFGCPGYSALFCPFVAAGISFSGTARSVVFAGADNQLVLDDVMLGASSPTEPTTTPEPASTVLAATGLAAIGILTRRRRRKNAR